MELLRLIWHPQVHRALEHACEAYALCEDAAQSAKAAVGELDLHPAARSAALRHALECAGDRVRVFYGLAAKATRLADGVLHTLDHVTKGLIDVDGLVSSH